MPPSWSLTLYRLGENIFKRDQLKRFGFLADGRAIDALFVGLPACSDMLAAARDCISPPRSLRDQYTAGRVYVCDIQIDAMIQSFIEAKLSGSPTAPTVSARASDC